MPRYIRGAKPRAYDDWCDDDSPLIPSITVEDNLAVDTGLLWPDGEPILRSPNAIGFHAEIE